MDNKKVRSTSSQVMELQQLIAGPLIVFTKISGLSDENRI